MDDFEIQDCINLFINNTSGIKIEIFVKENILECCDIANIYYYDIARNVSYVLNNEEPLVSNLNKLASCLSDIHENLLISNLPMRDLGYVWNDYHHSPVTNDTSNSSLENIGTQIGSLHRLWSSSYYVSWLYKENNRVYFDITPLYPWHYKELTSTASFISYEEFMKTYKRVVHQEIDATLIDRWLQQIEDILKIIRKNSGWEE